MSPNSSGSESRTSMYLIYSIVELNSFSRRCGCKGWKLHRHAYFLTKTFSERSKKPGQKINSNHSWNAAFRVRRQEEIVLKKKSNYG